MVVLQCIDTVGLASALIASSLQKLSDAVLAWLSVWKEMQMFQMMLLPPCHLLLL